MLVTGALESAAAFNLVVDRVSPTKVRRRGPTANVVTLARAVEIVRIAEAVIESARSGQTLATAVVS